MPVKRRRYWGHRAPSPKAASAVPDHGPVVPAMIKPLMEETAEVAKAELNETGKITPKAFFVFTDPSTPSVTRKVMVRLSNRSELQRDAARKRIEEKAEHEGARAVLVLYNERPGVLTVVGLADGARAAASVTYTFDQKLKTVGKWEMRWGS